METVQGIVIRTTDYKEKDKIIVLFTPRGILTLKARGVRSEKAKLKVYANIFTLGEFTFTGKENARILSGVELTDNFYSAWGEPEKVSAALVCFELAEKGFYREEDTSSEFIFLLKILNETVYGQTEPVCAALKFSVFCAQRLGADYGEIEAYDKSSYGVIKAFETAAIEDTGTLPYTKENVKKALILLHNVLKNHLGLKISTLNSVLRN